MHYDAVKLVYFSPTHTTQRTLEAIAAGVGASTVEHLNLTPSRADEITSSSDQDELVIIGAPVYAGRIPQVAAQRLRRLRGEGTPAVLVVVYGNRFYEDALLELLDVAREQGFVPVAGGVFLGQHTYSTPETPIAHGRPDAADLEKARAFGAQIRERLASLETLEDVPTLEVPGNRPYREGMQYDGSVVPITHEEGCILCEVCAEVCPTGAITVGNDVTTDASMCIACLACVMACPENAPDMPVRVLENKMIDGIARWLSTEHGDRKEPETYLC